MASCTTEGLGMVVAHKQHVLGVLHANHMTCTSIALHCGQADGIIGWLVSIHGACTHVATCD